MVNRRRDAGRTKVAVLSNLVQQETHFNNQNRGSSPVLNGTKKPGRSQA